MNPALKQLGFDEHDRVLIFHADDIGMCHATLPALADLLDFGLVSSAAVMVPCPWFPQTATFCREHPNVDMGVHLTLNCEWEPYRWGPISTRDPRSGLLDADGYFHAWPPATWQHADQAAVVAEIQAQVRRAKDAGIDTTHVDAHMATVAHPRFCTSYVDVALDNRLPVFLSRGDAARWRARGVDEDLIVQYTNLMQELEARGTPLVDNVAMLPLDDPSDQIARAKQIIDDLRPGLTELIFHPAHDTPELRALAPDWRSRVANYEVGLSTELRDYMRQSGVQLIGYRPLRELIRAS